MTFLTHATPDGFKDDFYDCTIFKTLHETGEIIEAPAKSQPRKPRARKEIEKIRPATNEIWICRGTKMLTAEIQIWGGIATGLFASSRWNQA